MQEINSMGKPVIMDQHGQLYIFEDKSELEEWKKKATGPSMTGLFEFECLSYFREYLDTLETALVNIDSLVNVCRLV